MQGITNTLDKNTALRTFKTTFNLTLPPRRIYVQFSFHVHSTSASALKLILRDQHSIIQMCIQAISIVIFQNARHTYPTAHPFKQMRLNGSVLIDATKVGRMIYLACVDVAVSVNGRCIKMHSQIKSDKIPAGVRGFPTLTEYRRLSPCSSFPLLIDILMS